MSNRDDDTTIIRIVLVLVLIFVVGITTYLTRHQRATAEAARQLSKTHMDDLADNDTLSQTDAWGNPMQFQRIATDTKVTQIITSSGADGTFGTSDDIRREDTDHNKSRIVGKWAKQRGKEFIKGLIGDERGRFDKPKSKPETEEPTTKPSIWDRLKSKVGK